MLECPLTETVTVPVGITLPEEATVPDSEIDDVPAGIDCEVKPDNDAAILLTDTGVEALLLKYGGVAS